ncbi:hypothetical protein KCU85_g4522, partial [Aureobasidium melanogenum]
MPYWHEKAIRHYDSAVNGLSQALQDGPQTNDKWKRETVLLLHLFEGFQSKDEESALGKAHLRGAHELFIPAVKEKSPISYHEILVLEAYIMHTTNNHLFQPDSQLPITHITEALETFTSALKRLNMECNWRSSPWIGFGGPELADMAYRVSWLTHKTYLDDKDHQEVEDLITYHQSALLYLPERIGAHARISQRILHKSKAVIYPSMPTRLLSRPCSL